MSGLSICLLTPSFLPSLGGMEIVVDRLARHFQAAGHRVLVLAKRPRQPLDPAGVPYPVRHFPRTRSTIWLLGPVFRSLLAEHRRCRFDVVHAHMAYPTGYVAARLAGRMGVPVVVTSHMGDVGPSSRFRHKFITRRRLCWTLRHADAVTGVSRELKTIIDELSGGQAKSTAIPNGVDPPQPPPDEMPARLAPLVRRPFMLTLGRLHRHKGLDVLLEAMALPAGPGAPTPQLVIAGEGKEMQSLQRQVAALGLAEGVRFVGTVLGAEKAWFLANCRFFLQPSRLEGMPLTVLEAMAYGKPVIASDLGGMRELIVPGRSGLLVAKESPRALAEAISQLAGSDLSAMSAMAKERAGAYSWSAVAGQYIELFEGLLAGRREGRA